MSKTTKIVIGIVGLVGVGAVGLCLVCGGAGFFFAKKGLKMIAAAEREVQAHWTRIQGGDTAGAYASLHAETRAQLTEEAFRSFLQRNERLLKDHRLGSSSSPNINIANDVTRVYLDFPLEPTAAGGETGWTFRVVARGSGELWAVETYDLVKGADTIALTPGIRVPTTSSGSGRD